VEVILEVGCYKLEDGKLEIRILFSVHKKSLQKNSAGIFLCITKNLF